MEDAEKKAQRDAKGRLLPGTVLNPSGKGGFNERPEDRSRRWTKRGSIKYNLRRYLEMTNEELAEIVANSKDLTQAEYMALQQVLDAKKQTERGFKIYQDVANRTEGSPRQQIDTNITQSEPPHITIDFK